MRTAPEDLRPDENTGWSTLIGHRRYRHPPASTTEPPWIGTFLEGSGMRVLGGDPRTLEMQALRFNAFFMANVKTTDFAVSWERNRPSARTRYMFLFVNHGSVMIEGASRRWLAPQAGLCVVFPGSEPVEISAMGPSEAVVFTFDQREIAPLTLSPVSMGDADPRSPVFRASYACLRAAAEWPRVGDWQDKTTEVLRSLTRDVAIAVTRAASSGSRTDGLFLHAQRKINELARNADLDVGSLARACDVSRRTLDRAYQARSRSVAEEIRTVRAQNALSLIMGSPLLPLGEIVSASGFRSLSSMNRALKEKYGLTGSQMRLQRMQTEG